MTEECLILRDSTIRSFFSFEWPSPKSFKNFRFGLLAKLWPNESSASAGHYELSCCCHGQSWLNFNIILIGVQLVVIYLAYNSFFQQKEVVNHLNWEFLAVRSEQKIRRCEILQNSTVCDHIHVSLMLVN